MKTSKRKSRTCGQCKNSFPLFQNTNKQFMQGTVLQLQCLPRQKNFTPLPSSSDIPQAFSEYFTNKIITITNRFPPVNPTVAMDKTTYSAKCYRHSHQSLNSLFWKFSKSLSPNHAILIPFPQKLLYENLDVLLSTITNIINTSLASGLVPPDFKTAIVKPLLKKPSLDQNVLKKLPSNLKPAISV